MKKNMAYKYAKKSMSKKEKASQERKNLLKDIPEEKTMARKNGDIDPPKKTNPPKKTDPPKKMFGSESLYKENKSYEDAVKAYDDSTSRNDSLMKNNFDEYLKSKTPTYPKMSDHFHTMSKEPPTKKMNKYDKDMMHERELIYDAKGQIHKADKEYKKGDKGKKQEMIHDREMIYDAKKEIHREDVAKKGSGHVVNRVAGRNSRG